MHIRNGADHRMIRVTTEQYPEYIPWAERCNANRVFPMSVAQGYQTGDIFTDDISSPRTVLFWHYCGFAYIVGEITDSILEELITDIAPLIDRRMVLITDSEDSVRYFTERYFELGKRIEYGHSGEIPDASSDPDIVIAPVGEDNIDLITGKIVPSFSWERSDFLLKGSGYAAFCGGKYCGVAFSSAVSSSEVDIGVEVDPSYRGRGIATALCARMVREISSQGRKPVWAHGEANTGSRNTAVKCGFIEEKINSFIMIKQ